MNRQLYIIAGTSLLLLASCSQKKWSVEGKIEGAEGKELILEGANELGGWYGIDTLTVENDGTYAFHGLPTGHPEIYRLRLGSESAYFPIDSLETVTLNGSLANFATTYTLAGSPEADAMQYINEDTHTWKSTADFLKAIEAVAAIHPQVGVVFCGGQGGDQGTRALVNNLYNGTFATPEHDRYTWDDSANIQALEQLKSMPGITFDASLEGGDEIKVFYQGHSEDGLLLEHRPAAEPQPGRHRRGQNRQW